MQYVLSYVNRDERHKKTVTHECRVYIFHAPDDEGARYKANVFLKNGRRLFKRNGGQRVEISLAPCLFFQSRMALRAESYVQ